jgi:hypothetical protein
MSGEVGEGLGRVGNLMKDDRALREFAESGLQFSPYRVVGVDDQDLLNQLAHLWDRAIESDAAGRRGGNPPGARRNAEGFSPMLSSSAFRATKLRRKALFAGGGRMHHSCREPDIPNL